MVLHTGMYVNVCLISNRTYDFGLYLLYHLSAAWPEFMFGSLYLFYNVSIDNLADIIQIHVFMYLITVSHIDSYIVGRRSHSPTYRHTLLHVICV